MKKVFIISFMLVSMLLAGCAGVKPAENTAADQPFLAVSLAAKKSKSRKLNTTLQVVPRFGQCYFVPVRDEVGTWYFISPKNKMFTIEQMRSKCPPSFGAIADSEGGLWIYNIDKYLDEWQVVCKFADGSTTMKGKIKIDYSLPAEAPITHPIEAVADPDITKTIKLNTNVQIVPEYGQCYFCTERDDRNTWYFINPNGQRFTIAAMRDKCPPAFGAMPDDEGGLWLYNIGKWIDGWSVMCVYPDGTASEPGLIKINYSLPAEAIMTHPM